MKEKTNTVNEALQLALGEAFDHELIRSLEEAGGVGYVTIAMLDLDNFLLVNNSFGHATGDRVLIETGTYLRESIPKGARLYRYAGDCFSVLFPSDTEKEDAFLVMEEIRKNYSVKTPDGVSQNITIGIASSPDDGVQITELIRKAEGAMFRGKLNGRNRVCLAREEKMVTKTSHYTTEQLQRLTKLSKRESIGEAILLREALDALLKKYEV